MAHNPELDRVKDVREMDTRLLETVRRHRVVVFGHAGSAQCSETLRTLGEHSAEVPPTLFDLGRMPNADLIRTRLSALTAHVSAPFVFINGRFVGGHRTVATLRSGGGLDELFIGSMERGLSAAARRDDEGADAGAAPPLRAFVGQPSTSGLAPVLPPVPFNYLANPDWVQLTMLSVLSVVLNSVMRQWLVWQVLGEVFKKWLVEVPSAPQRSRLAADEEGPRALGDHGPRRERSRTAAPAGPKKSPAKANRRSVFREGAQRRNGSRKPKRPYSGTVRGSWDASKTHGAY